MKKIKKHFPKIKKSIKSFLSNESWKITKKDALGLSLWTLAFWMIDEASWLNLLFNKWLEANLGTTTNWTWNNVTWHCSWETASHVNVSRAGHVNGAVTVTNWSWSLTGGHASHWSHWSHWSHNNCH